MTTMSGTHLFRPNLVQTVTEDDLPRLSLATRRITRRALPAKATAIRLQIRSIQIMRGLDGWLGMSAHGVLVISSVVDGMTKQPITYQGRPYLNVHDGDFVPIGPVGDPDAVYNVYLREGELPRTLAFSLLVLRSNAGIRDLGNVIGAAMADERYKSLAETLSTAVTAASPVYGTVLQVAQGSISLIADHLKAKPDDQLGYYQVNYTNQFDSLGVGRHPAKARSIAVDKIRLAYQLDAS